MVCIAAALTVSVMSPAAAAIPTRVTAGEAHAVFQSQWVGGVAIGSNPASPVAAPGAEDVASAVMSPISSSPDDPFCVLDWHAIRVLLSLSSSEDLAASDVHISLDGAPIDLVTTAIKPFPHFDLYGRGYGLVVPPGTPAVGRHTLTATIDLFTGASLDFGTTVIVGSADSPACTGS